MLATAAATSFLVVVGAATRDVDRDDPRGWRVGGTVTYGALGAAALGIHVRALIGVDAITVSAAELDLLRHAGVDVRTVALERGPIFENRHTPNGREQVAMQVSDRLPPDALPADWRTPTAAILGPVAGELGDEWSHAFPTATLIALAWQGLLRRLTPGALVERVPMARTPLVERADALLVSAEDVTPQPPGLRQLLRPGQQLVVTHGDRGALHLVVEGVERVRGRYLPPAPRRNAVDTTGAGDVFLAAWVAALAVLGERESWRALAAASTMASLSVTRRALAEMPTLEELCTELVRLRDRPLD